MSLIIKDHSNEEIPENKKHYIDGKAKAVHTIEHENDFWPGQLRHVGWLEAHDDGCDSRRPWDRDWDNNESKNK